MRMAFAGMAPEDISSTYAVKGGSNKSASTYLEESFDNTPDPGGHYRITVGSLWIRPSDLLKLTMLLCGDGSYEGVRILSQESVLAMRESQRGKGGITAESPYGLSMARVENLVPGRMVYGHQGTDEPIVCNAYFDPETTLCVTIMTNGCHSINDDRINLMARQLVPLAYRVAGLNAE